MKKFILCILFMVICILSFLVGNYFYIKNQYEDMYLHYISKKYDINDIEVEDVYFVLKTNSFDCYYEQKSTGRHFMASKTSGGRQHIIEYTFDYQGNLSWNDSWDISQ